MKRPKTGCKKMARDRYKILSEEEKNLKESIIETGIGTCLKKTNRK